MLAKYKGTSSLEKALLIAQAKALNLIYNKKPSGKHVEEYLKYEQDIRMMYRLNCAIVEQTIIEKSVSEVEENLSKLTAEQITSAARWRFATKVAKAIIMCVQIILGGVGLYYAASVGLHYFYGTQLIGADTIASLFSSSFNILMVSFNFGSLNLCNYLEKRSTEATNHYWKSNTETAASTIGKTIVDVIFSGEPLRIEVCAADKFKINLKDVLGRVQQELARPNTPAISTTG